jgi:hypothetical protein
MPPYLTMHVENTLWLLLGGTLFALVIILAVGSRFFSFDRRREEQHAQSTHHFGEGLEEQRRPAPLLIWMVFVGYFVWAIAYVVFVGARGL